MVRKINIPVSLGIFGNLDCVNSMIFEKGVEMRKNEMFALFDIILKLMEYSIVIIRIPASKSGTFSFV